MSIPTPTSNPVSHAAPSLPQADLPAGLPDVATLARLANEFFSSVPGSATPAAASLGSGAGESLSATLPLTAPVTSSASNPAPPGSPFAGPGGAGTGIPGLSIPQGKVPGANLAPSSPMHVRRWAIARPRSRRMRSRMTGCRTRCRPSRPRWSHASAAGRWARSQCRSNALRRRVRLRRAITS